MFCGAYLCYMELNGAKMWELLEMLGIPTTIEAEMLLVFLFVCKFNNFGPVILTYFEYTTQVTYQTRDFPILFVPIFYSALKHG